MEAITSFSQLDLSKTYSYADYLSWKFEEFVELIRGRVLRHMVGPSTQHQKISQRLEYSIMTFLRKGQCQMFHAPYDVRLTRGNATGDAQIRSVVQPDIFVVCDGNKIDARGCVGAPDWIIEILSPGNVGHDTKIKFDLYEESGVREYWIVVPGLQSVTAYVLDAQSQYQLAAEYAEPGSMPVATLPGLAVEWGEVFNDL